MRGRGRHYIKDAGGMRGICSDCELGGHLLSVLASFVFVANMNAKLVVFLACVAYTYGRWTLTLTSAPAASI